MTTQVKVSIQSRPQINARINNIAQPRVNAINYGGKYRIKDATDLNFPSFDDGYVMAYSANNQTFVGESPSSLAQNIENYINLDAGFF
jgi:hypothetical protein